MATLVLGTVGSIVAGPIGGAIGAVLGNQIDRRVLAPKGRQGPRLGDLSVQTSSYGSELPRLFGTMRVAGTVIWATDLREDVHHSGGGKGGASTTSYSYSASFAVALSARPIRSVGRIWADGNLLRGAGGDWKSETGFRLYLGSEDQNADPLIASAEGIDSAPAHRGIAYAVFEAMQLGDYGNRIPMLTFEVVADSGKVTLAAIAGELADGAIAGEGGATVSGYAAGGDSIRGALEALADGFVLDVSDDGTTLRLNDATDVPIDLALAGANGSDRAQPARERVRAPASTLADAVAVQYYEPQRDFQAGLQRARRDGIGRREARIELPAALSAGAARGVAEDSLSRRWIEREQATVRLPWCSLGIRCGTRVMLGTDGLWRVTGWSLDQMVLTLSLKRVAAGSIAIPGAAPGRAAVAADQIAGQTRLVLLDLPALDDTVADAPRMWLAAAGTQPGWRRAEASMSVDGGASWRGIGQTALPAVIGSAVDVLPPGSPFLFDRVSAVTVALLNEAMVLQGTDDAGLVGGANLAMLGQELVQFATVQPIAGSSYQLSGLLRGRRGTEWAIGTHRAGEPFVLLDPATLKPLDVPVSAVGAKLELSAVGPGDSGVPAATALAVTGTALLPPAPVSLRGSREADGSVRFSWTRRSRAGWAWLDGSDAPLAEDAERYRIVISPAIGADRAAEVTSAEFVYGPAMQAADGSAATSRFTITVAQIGTRGTSTPPASTVIFL